MKAFVYLLLLVLVAAAYGASVEEQRDALEENDPDYAEIANPEDELVEDEADDNDDTDDEADMDGVPDEQKEMMVPKDGSDENAADPWLFRRRRRRSWRRRRRRRSWRRRSWRRRRRRRRRGKK